MKHSKTIKRPDGSKVCIDVRMIADSYRNEMPEYRVTVSHCLPRKRNFYFVVSTDSYEWRKLDSNGKRDYEIKKYLEYVTLDEIQAVKLELWEMIKPQ